MRFPVVHLAGTGSHNHAGADCLGTNGGPDSAASVRAIVPEGTDCPAIDADGELIPLKVRAEPEQSLIPEDTRTRRQSFRCGCANWRLLKERPLLH